MRSYKYLVMALVSLFSLLFTVSPPGWAVLLMLLALAFPFSLVILTMEMEVALIIGAFLFCSIACSGYAMESLVIYAVYWFAPLVLLKYQRSVTQTISETVFLKFLGSILMAATFIVSLWWRGSGDFFQIHEIFRIWPGYAALMAGTYVAIWLIHIDYEACKSFSVTMSNYWFLSVFLMLAVLLYDAHYLFVGMALAALLPFTLESLLLIRKIWGERSPVLFFILGCCATISVVPLCMLGLYSVFRPWIKKILNEKE